MSKNISKLHALSLIVTLPMTIFFIILFFNSKNLFYSLDKYHITTPVGERLSTSISHSYLDLKYKLLHSLGVNKKADVNLIIEKSKLNSLYANLPRSGNIYQDNSYLIIDNKVLKGKAKLRGDFFYHWAFPIKSWRFKASKKNIHNNIRKYNFIVPERTSIIPDYLSFKLAFRLNLIAPEAKLIDFSINNVYQGVRLMIEQIDENFLRNMKLMPGDVYKGDNIGQKQFLGITSPLFNHPELWDKVAYNNHYNLENKYPLSYLLKNFNKASNSQIDMKSFASMSALIDITSTAHFDDIHNWIIYYDNYREKFYPIIWDTFAWKRDNPIDDHINLIGSDIFHSMYKDYDFIRLKYQILYDFFKNNEKLFLNDLREASLLSENFIHQNGYSVSSDGIIINKENSLIALDELKNRVKVKLDKIKNALFGKVLKNNYKYSIIDNGIRISINGDKIIKQIIIHLEKPHTLTKIPLSYLQNNIIKKHHFTNDSNEANKIVLNTSLLANAKLSNLASKIYNIQFTDATYDLDLGELNPEYIKSIELKINNFNQEYIEINKVNKIVKTSFPAHLQNVIKTKSTRKTIVWSGIKHINGFNIIKDNLTILPGTEIRLDQGATIKLLGQIKAIGTIDSPIIFDSIYSHKPWGALALIGEAANGSVFKHVIFKNGSGDKGKMHEYTAMLSIHDVQNLLIENTEFYDSKITDDMLHIIYSDVVLKDSKFVRSYSDAVDIDISKVLITNCKFINSGNDSIDLMTSEAVVLHSLFEGSKDKGISIGENSKLLAIDNLLLNNEIGMQSKDNSVAYTYNTSFISNKIAIDAYLKNWRYSDGGTLFVDKCVMKNNKQNTTIGKKSRIVINDCSIFHQTVSSDKTQHNQKYIEYRNEEMIKPDFNWNTYQNYSDLIQKNRQGITSKRNKSN